MQAQSNPHWDFEVRVVTWIALCISVFSFLYYYRSGEIMLYGDAEAHINVARRVFDSKTPGPLQLGTVWLPLPHLLMMPFLVSDKLWTTGVGGSIPSLVAYIFAVIGIFRLMRDVLRRKDDKSSGAHPAAWLAAAVFACNPNLIYMQTTAMTEVLYLAFFIWGVVFFAEFLLGEEKSLNKCGWLVAAACLTRYDGWFLAGVLVALIIILYFAKRVTLRVASQFILIAAAAPVLWLAYNAAVYRNPLEFENGPYSAKAIEQRTENKSAPGHPGSGDIRVSAQYFLKAAESNMAANESLQRLWIALLLVGAVAIFIDISGGASRALLAVVFLFAVPLPFYALSIAYAGVPIFIPAWWPFTQYNTRYGLQFLPALAAAAAVVLGILLAVKSRRNLVRILAVLVVLGFVVASYATVWQSGPICLTEAETNMRGRVALEIQVAKWLDAMPPNATILMYLGSYPGVLQRANVPISRVINEGNHRVWMQPRDNEGLWERALADPAKYADFVIAFQGGPVWQAVHNMRLKEVVEIKVTGQPRAVIYQTR